MEEEFKTVAAVAVAFLSSAVLVVALASLPIKMEALHLALRPGSLVRLL